MKKFLEKINKNSPLFGEFEKALARNRVIVLDDGEVNIGVVQDKILSGLFPIFDRESRTFLFAPKNSHEFLVGILYGINKGKTKEEIECDSRVIRPVVSSFGNGFNNIHELYSEKFISECSGWFMSSNGRVFISDDYRKSGKEKIILRNL